MTDTTHFIDPPSWMRNHLANGGLPGEVLTEWVGAEEAKRLRVEVMQKTEDWLAQVCNVPVGTVRGWESGELAPDASTVTEPPDWGMPQLLALYALAAFVEKNEMPPAKSKEASR